MKLKDVVVILMGTSLLFLLGSGAMAGIGFVYVLNEFNKVQSTMENENQPEATTYSEVAATACVSKAWKEKKPFVTASLAGDYLDDAAQTYSPGSLALVNPAHTGRPKYIRWAPRTQALKVYFQKHPQGSRYIPMARDAVNQWRSVAGKNLTFKEVHNEAEADISVVWVPSISEHPDYAGITEQKSNGSCLVQSKIQVALVHGHNGGPVSEQDVYMTVLHEMGHALGIPHSSNINDVMYPTTESTAQIGHLSQRDLNSLQRLYQMELIETEQPQASNNYGSPGNFTPVPGSLSGQYRN